MSFDVHLRVGQYIKFHQKQRGSSNMGLRVFGVQIEDKERGLARKYKGCLCEGMAIAFTGKASKWIFEWLLFPTSSQRTKWDIENSRVDSFCFSVDSL